MSRKPSVSVLPIITWLVFLAAYSIVCYSMSRLNSHVESVRRPLQVDRGRMLSDSQRNQLHLYFAS